MEMETGSRARKIVTTETILTVTAATPTDTLRPDSSARPLKTKPVFEASAETEWSSTWSATTRT